MAECILKKYMRLKDAILHEQLDFVRQTLSNKKFHEKFMDYKLYSKCHVSLLNMAVIKNNVAMVELLLSFELTPNIFNVTKYEDSRALSICDSADIKWAKNIQSVDSSSSLSSFSKTTPLHQAVLNQNVELVKLLLDHDANPNALDHLNHDTFYYAMIWDSECVPIKEVFLEQAIKYGKTSVVEVLLKYIVVKNFRDSNGQGLMHYAANARYKNIDIVHILFEAGASFDQIDINGKTPLHDAVVNKNIDMVKFLLDHGANINAETDDNETPLFLAVSSQNVPMVKFLLEKKPLIDEKRTRRETALLKACNQENEDIVYEFLRYGVNVDTQMDYHDLWKFLTKVIVKLDQQGDSIGKEYLKILRNSQRPCIITFLKQFDKMKDCLIFEDITVFDIFFKSEKKFMTLLRYNKNLREALQSIDYDGFPHYEKKLCLKINRMLKKIDELDRHENELIAIFGMIFPNEIIRKITEYVIEDLDFNKTLVKIPISYKIFLIFMQFLDLVFYFHDNYLTKLLQLLTRKTLLIPMLITILIFLPWPLK